MARKKTDKPAFQMVTSRRKQRDIQALWPDLTGSDGKYKGLYYLACANWEGLRRKPEYLKLTEEIEFLPIGTVNPQWIIDNRNRFDEIAKEAKRLFGIDQIIDPARVASDLPLDVITLFGVLPMIVEAICPDDWNVIYKDEDEFKKRFVEDGKYLTLRIDITQKDNVIDPLIKFHIQHYRQFVKAESSRQHYEKHLQYYKVWDERKKKVSVSIIARKTGNSVDTIKKRFYAAYELIMEQPYDQDFFNEIPIFKAELGKTCETCIDKECLKTFKKGREFTPCPDVVFLINQDQSTKKEFFEADYHLLYSEDRQED